MAEHTFLFADLVGFTALTDSEGDDRAAEVALELYDHVRRLLPHHEAEELKTLGDGIALRCESAANGIELAVAIVEDLDSLPSFPPVRVGVHTGPAVERDGDWYGRTVNVAARLCAAAGGGEALVSEHACKAAGRLRSVEFDERRLHWLRNVTEPIPAQVASRRERKIASRLAPLRQAFTPPAHSCWAGVPRGVPSRQ